MGTRCTGVEYAFWLIVCRNASRFLLGSFVMLGGDIYALDTFGFQSLLAMYPRIIPDRDLSRRLISNRYRLKLRGLGCGGSKNAGRGMSVEAGG